MKLWQNKNTNTKNADIQKIVEVFTIGNDNVIDLYLAESDIVGTKAHATMLESIGLITSEELKQLEKALEEILKSIHAGEFIIEPGIEDVHSQIELLLTKQIGDIGKKIHSGRSRNDQSILNIKLFLKQEIKSINNKVKKLFECLVGLSEQHKDALIPGYTHMQLAMPSSFGLWFGAYAESLSEDLELLIAAYNICNSNPLGSAAGYGSGLPINRKMTTELLNFDHMNYNVVYAQMTRGKTEKIVSIALASIAATLSKFTMDICLYMNQNFGFISFPEVITTGSSIMPHKKNPDVFELIRGKCNRIQAVPNELSLLTNNLPSGYHREMQLTKECIINAILETKNCLDILPIMLEHIIIKHDILSDEKYKYLFSVENANALALSGMPFRDAYRKVADDIANQTFQANYNLNHTHEGSIGNLCNEQIQSLFNTRWEKINNK
jgi:argininosuccinate lyase